MTERAPHARRVDEQFEADLTREVIVVAGLFVADHRVGDVGRDVKRRRAGRPIPRTLLTVDRPPGKRRTVQVERLRAFEGLRHRVVAPAQRVARRPRGGVGEHGQDEGLGVPERVPVIAGASQPLGRDRASLGPGARLEDVKEREADRLLELGITVELDVGPLPEVVQVHALGVGQPCPSSVERLDQGGPDLVAHGRGGPLARPSIGHELGHPQRLSRRHIGGDHDPGEIGKALHCRLGARGTLDEVIHRHGHAQAAGLGVVHEDGSVPAVIVKLAAEGCAQGRGRAGIAVAGGHRLVGHQSGLDDHPARRVDGLNLVADGGHGALGERHQPGGGDAHRLAGRWHPLGAALQHPGAEIEPPLVTAQLPVAQVERLIVDEQADDLGVGDVDDRLTGLGVAVAGLGVGHRAQLVEPIEIGPGQSEGLSLVEVAPQPDVAVGQREHRLGLG